MQSEVQKCNKTECHIPCLVFKYAQSRYTDVLFPQNWYLSMCWENNAIFAILLHLIQQSYTKSYHWEGSSVQHLFELFRSVDSTLWSFRDCSLSYCYVLYSEVFLIYNQPWWKMNRQEYKKRLLFQQCWYTRHWKGWKSISTTETLKRCWTKFMHSHLWMKDDVLSVCIRFLFFGFFCGKDGSKSSGRGVKAITTPTTPVTVRCLWRFSLHIHCVASPILTPEGTLILWVRFKPGR